MKKLIVLIIFSLWIFNSFSQNTKDSVTCIPNYQLRAAIKDIYEGKKAQAELLLMRENANLYSQRIALKDSIIAQYQQKDTFYKVMQENYSENQRLWAQKYELCNSLASDLNKKLRKQKVKNIFTVIGGIVTTSAAIYFLTR